MFKYKLNCKRQQTNFNGRVYTAPFCEVAKLPAEVDLEPLLPAVLDQAQEGSCVDNATASHCKFRLMQEGLTVIDPARNFLYWNARALEGTTSEDSGSSVADGVKAAEQWGFCDESQYPYDSATFLTKPASAIYGLAWHHKGLTANAVAQSLAQIQAALAAKKLVQIGFTCYPELQSDAAAKTGYVPLPKSGEQSIGGHCVLLVGYSTKTGRFKFRNSWSEQWGVRGYGFFDYEYMLNANWAGDFWTILKDS